MTGQQPKASRLLLSSKYTNNTIPTCGMLTIFAKTLTRMVLPRPRRLPRLSTITAQTAGSDYILPWLPSPKPSTHGAKPSPPQTFTNASILKSITTAGNKSPKQLLTIYSLAGKQPGFRHDYPTYKILILILAQKRHNLPSVLLLLDRMRRVDFIPIGPALLLPLLDVYVSHSDLSDESLLGKLFLSAPIHEKVFSKLVNLLISTDRIRIARTLFSDAIISKFGFDIKVRHYVDLLRAYCDKGEYQSIHEVLDVMAERGSAPNVFCFGALIDKACRRDGVNGLDFGFGLVEQMRRKWDRNPDVVIWNTLLTGCVRNGEMERAEGVLKMMEDNNIVKDVWTYNTVIVGMCKHQSLKDGVRVFVDMLEKRIVPPDVVTFTTLIDWSCLRQRQKKMELGIFLGKMMRLGIVPDSACWRIILTTQSISDHTPKNYHNFSF